MIDSKISPGDEASVRVNVERLSKKYCTHLKRSLWYGIQDIADEFNVWRNRAGADLRPHEFWALNDISFQVCAGEAVGIIGPNGAGKSTLLKVLSGLTKPDHGHVHIHGRVGSLIELGTGFNPGLTGRENIYINAAVMGLAKKQTQDLVDEILDFAELENFIDTPLANYSSGMWVRLAYAIATCLKPDVLLVDEVLAVGDFSFQRKCIQHLLNLIKNGSALVLVSHNLYMVQTLCARALVLDHGRVVFSGTSVESVARYFEMKTDMQIPMSAREQMHASDANESVSIERVEVLPLDREELLTDAPARVVITYCADQEISNVYCSFTFWTADLLVCITGARKLMDLTQGAGHTKICCTVPHLPLSAGVYAARADFFDSEACVPYALYGWQNPPLYFRVSAALTEFNNLRAVGNMLITLDVAWE